MRAEKTFAYYFDIRASENDVSLQERTFQTGHLSTGRRLDSSYAHHTALQKNKAKAAQLNQAHDIVATAINDPPTLYNENKFLFDAFSIST